MYGYLRISVQSLCTKYTYTYVLDLLETWFPTIYVQAVALKRIWHVFWQKSKIKVRYDHQTVLLAVSSRQFLFHFSFIPICYLRCEEITWNYLKVLIINKIFVCDVCLMIKYLLVLIAMCIPASRISPKYYNFLNYFLYLISLVF